MENQNINRRTAVQFLGLSAGVSIIPGVKVSAINPKPVVKPSFIYSLNMATIRGHNLGFMKELEIASKAGFRSVEIWIDSLQEYLQKGGTLKEVKARLNDLGLTVENCIAFAQWVVDDDTIRNQALEQSKREMDMMAVIGCKRIAATGKGVENNARINPDVIAKRYRTMLELGDKTGVLPMLEMWGFLKILGRVSDCTYIAMQSAHPKACILLDVFHLYRGETPLDTLHLLNPMAVPVLHMNDYPSTIAAPVITDADRIYPGDGVAPIKQILKTLKRTGQPLVLSVELFNKNYYSQDALVVAKTALEKVKGVAEGV